MAEYISREAALQFVFDACAECLESALEFDGINPDCHYCMLEGVKLKLRDYPTADVQPVRHGRWQITDAWPHNVYCSECHTRFAQTHWAVWEDGSLPRNYCPNCGAKMDSCP